MIKAGDTVYAAYMLGGKVKIETAVVKKATARQVVLTKRGGPGFGGKSHVSLDDVALTKVDALGNLLGDYTFEVVQAHAVVDRLRSQMDAIHDAIRAESKGN